ncbi:MAG TPA: hypothetical protein VHO70_24095 [Chitinispirillaceae bacterium]|nr:hypothetical protein [Chitinispirillaceae bacterium]
MISKTGTQIFITLFIAIMTFVDCINDPSNKNWNPEDEFKIEYIPQLEKLLCSKDGRYYGLTGDCVIFFDSTTLSGKIPSSKLKDSEGARNIFLDRNQDLIIFGDFGARRYRFTKSGKQIDDFDNQILKESTFYTANTDSGLIIGVTREQRIISWDGASLSYHGILWNDEICREIIDRGIQQNTIGEEEIQFE